MLVNYVYIYIYMCMYLYVYVKVWHRSMGYWLGSDSTVGSKVLAKARVWCCLEVHGKDWL